MRERTQRLTPDSNHFLTASSDGTLKLWRPLDEEEDRTFPGPDDRVAGVAVTPDGRQLWVTNRAEDTVSVIKTGSRSPIAKLEAGSFPIRAETAAHGRVVLVTNARGNDLSVYSTSELKEIGRVSFEAVSKDTEGRLFSDRFGTSSVPIGIEVVDDERRAYIAHANADDISIIDLEQWKIVGVLSAGREPDGMGYSPLVPGTGSEE